MSVKRRLPPDQQPVDKVEDGDSVVRGREDDQDTPSWPPRRVERRAWRGEGAVSNDHTD